MNVRSEMVLKGFLARCTPEIRRALVRFLPPSEQELLSELPSFQTESETVENSLENVHWSWFLPTLKSFHTEEQRLFLATLSPLAAENLSRELGIEDPIEPISEMAKSYLREQLLYSLTESWLPAAYLPASPLNALLQLTKKELIQLIDRLAMYDLAVEMRQIVETKILKKIYSFLTEDQKVLLKQIGTQKESYPLPKLGLDRWDGSEETLKTLLHKRGITRLGVALSGQDPDLIWAICHQLDIGRGNALYKQCAKEPTVGVSSAIIHQIEELIR